CMVPRHRNGGVQMIGVALPQGGWNWLWLLVVVGQWRLGDWTGERIGAVLVLVGLVLVFALALLAREVLLQLRVPGVVERRGLGAGGGGWRRGCGGIVRHQRCPPRAGGGL